MTMRNDFETILKRYGHNVYLQRHDLGEDGEIVYRDTLEQHTVRFSIGIARALPKNREEALEGILNTSERFYHFKYDVNPFENDRIYEYVDRSEDDREVYVIDNAVGMRGTDGRIVYWQVGATRIVSN